MKKLEFISIIGAGALICVALTGTAVAGGKSCDKRSNNNHKKLLECVTLDGVRGHQAELQQIADENGGTRASGTQGFNDSAWYIGTTLEAAGYAVEYQPFEFSSYREYDAGLEQISPNSTIYTNLVDFAGMSYSGSGDATASATAVDFDLGLGNGSTSGCEASDFGGFPVGNIAIIQRGACNFVVKAKNAEAAGAVGVVIFNQGNTEQRKGVFGGTLGSGANVGIPVIGIGYDLGVELIASANAGTLILRTLLDSEVAVIQTANVLADSPFGNPDNVVMAGGHLDSVEEGPGINDNGSGSAALLEIALKMAKVETVNKVRFAWWGAEESGLIGSTAYIFDPEFGVTQEEYDALALYLNFDMVASPNYVFGVYDGDGSDFGLVGPPGSDAIEATFKQFYAAAGEPSQGSAFSGRSDYSAFIQVGIPAGGLFTGAEGIKTPEEAALYGGTAGEQYDPCYHAACDTFDNVSLKALDVNSDAIAYAILKYAMNTETINGIEGKGNFKERKLAMDAEKGAMFEYSGNRLQK
jgi:Zn-dependent M28 family amino/carboxypeptidase